MLRIKDHKTLDMFDRFAHLGPKRRQLLDSSWAKLFRGEILPHLPVHFLTEYFDLTQGRPSNELFAMMGSMILQQMHDLTDEQTVEPFCFNIQWYFALNINNFRAGVEATMSEFDRRTGVKRLRVRGMKAVRFAVFMKAIGLNIRRAVAFVARRDKNDEKQRYTGKGSFYFPGATVIKELLALRGRLTGMLPFAIFVNNEVAEGYDLRLAA